MKEIQLVTIKKKMFKPSYRPMVEMHDYEIVLSSSARFLPPPLIEVITGC